MRTFGILSGTLVLLWVGFSFWGTKVSEPALAEISPNSLRLLENPVQHGKLAFHYKVEGRSAVNVIDFKNGSIQQLVDTDGNDSSPSWSPDGSKLVFSSDVSGDLEIYVVSADGKQKQRLTNSPGEDDAPHWSPLGDQIVFRSARGKGKGSDIYVMNPDGSEQQLLVAYGRNAKNSGPRWSPDGTKVFFTTNRHFPGWDIMLFDIATNKLDRRSKGTKTFCRPAWHPSGKYFVYSHGAGHTINLWSQTLDKKNSRLTDEDLREYDAEWIDEKRFFFVREQRKGAGDYQIYLFDIENKAVIQITSGSGSIRDLAWSKS